MTTVAGNLIAQRQKELDDLLPEYNAALAALTNHRDAYIARSIELLQAEVQSGDQAMILLGRLAEAARPLTEPGLVIAAYLSKKASLERLKLSV